VQGIQYISDLGGVFGLWFGFAFMTFIEMCEFVTDLMLLVVKSGAVRSKPSHKSHGTPKKTSSNC